MRGKFVIALMLSAFAVSGAAASEFAHPVPANVPVVPWKSFSIQYTVRDVGIGPKSVEFFITSDMGRTWKRYGEDPDARSPMRISVPGDGVYGFMTVGTDHVGNREREPVSGTRPETVIIVDRTPPEARWILPNKPIMLRSDGGIELAWEAGDAHLGAGPVSIEYSTDGGQSWLPVRSRLGAKGKLTWNPSLGMAGQVMLRLVVRDRAGNRLTLKNRHTVVRDTIPPTAKITSPTMSRSRDIDLTYTAKDNEGGMGVDAVTLYYTENDGQTWRKFGNDPDSKSPMRFSSRVAGRVGVMLVVTDKAGNRSPLPKGGMAPPFYVEIDQDPPQVEIDRAFPQQKALRGGEAYVVRWTAADPHIENNSASFFYSIDGGQTWKQPKKATGLPVNGAFTWSVPREVQSDECFVRVRVRDMLGNVGTGQSLAFAIDRMAPDVEILEVNPVEGSDSQPQAENRDDADQFEGDYIPPEDMVDETAELRPEVPEPTELDKAPIIPETPEPTAKQPAPTPEPDEPEPVTRVVARLPDEGAGVEPRPEVPEPADLMPETPEPMAKQPEPAVPQTPEPTAKQPEPVVPETSDTAKQPAPVPDETEPVARAPEPIVPEKAPAPTEKERAAALVNEAMTLMKERRAEQALATAREAISLDPTSDTAYATLSRLLTASRRPGEALQAAQKALQINNEDMANWLVLGDARFGHARLLHQEALTRSGEEQARIVDKRDKMIRLAQEVYTNVIRSGDAERKKHAYDRLGDLTWFVAKHSSAAQRPKALRQAIKVYQKGYEIEKPNYKEAFQIGMLHFQLHMLQADEALLRESLRYLEKAVEVQETGSAREAFWYLAMVHQKLGNTEDAIRYWQRVRDAYPAGQYRTQAEEQIRALQSGL